MPILRYLWIVMLSIAYAVCVISVISNIVICVIAKEKPTTSAIIFIVGTLLFGLSFIYWAVTL